MRLINAIKSNDSTKIRSLIIDNNIDINAHLKTVSIVTY